MQSSSLPIPKDVRWRRLLGVALFLVLLYVFRHLAPVLIIFVIFERGFGFAADKIARYTSISRKWAIAGLLTAFLGVIGFGIFFAVKRILAFIDLAQRDGATWVATIANSSIIQMARERLGMTDEQLTDQAKHYAPEAFSYVTATAYFGIFVFVGFILAVMYLFERKDIDEWTDNIDPRSISGTLARWLGYVADAIAITVRLQVVVALFNALFTLPLLIILGLPAVPLLFMLVLLGGMVPVVGGIVSGSILCIVAYDAKGAVGVGVFLGLTFVLSKVESYYLSPRLTAQHVKLPGLVLVIALLMFETIFGFYGFFLSFPALYVASRIKNEWNEEDAEIRARGASLSRPPPPSTLTPVPIVSAAPPAPASAPPPPAVDGGADGSVIS